MISAIVTFAARRFPANGSFRVFVVSVCIRESFQIRRRNQASAVNSLRVEVSCCGEPAALSWPGMVCRVGLASLAVSSPRRRGSGSTHPVAFVVVVPLISTILIFII